MGNSSSTPSSSTTTNVEQYDVFISFRGEDTRNGFTSHLYHALHEKQIKTFIDNQLVRGEEISEGLLSVIRESKISVIIFSENYAFSRWCLRELEEIMKNREMKKQIVIPVFYEVDPSHVRKQIGSYEAAFAKHENELQQEDEVKKWRQALTEASNIIGFDSSKARPESKFVHDIVRDIWNKLNNISPSCDFKGLVGIDKHIDRVVSLLCLEAPDSRIIGIWGMGGMGKTTIADAVFHLVSHQFEKRTHFAPCVRAESEKDSNGLIRLRNEILSKVLNIENPKSGSPSIPQWIKRLLKQNKVLIVLDDVDKFTEWEILAGGLDDDDDGLALGSRIILTTRDKQVLRNCGVEDHNMYNVEGLNDDEALQLFCKYAFKQNHPTKDVEVLSREVVKIATNVPLAVKVLGSLLYKKSKRDWENAIDKFQRSVNHRVIDVLKISYDGLDEEEKGLFLDIACFVEFEFRKDEVHFPPNLLSDREFSLDGLIDKSLVTVEDRGHLKMHDLLREMGREIASKNGSRLWRQEDVLRTLKHNDGTGAVQGIFISMSKLKDVYLRSQALKKMYGLRTLILKYDYPHQASFCYLDYLPDELRYFHWEMYPLEILPSSFNPVNLVELDLKYSNIKQLWEGRTCVPKLKRLNLSSCWNLIRIPDLSNIPSAESINLERCVSLLEIHSSTKCPKNLHSLQLSACRNLRSCPSNIHMEGSEFSLCGCISLTKFPHISGNIRRLDLSGSLVEEVPSTIQSLSKLEGLIMANCTRLRRISKSICKLKSLDRLDLMGCCKLESFQDILEGMEQLKYLNLSGTEIKELPPSVGNLNRLEELVLSDCKNLETFPNSIFNLRHLSGLCSLKELRLNNCNLTEISEDISCLSSLKKLELHGNLFERLPKSIKKLSKLYYLTVSYCGMLRSLPELPSSLRHLKAMNCKQLIQSLPDESEFELCADDGGSLVFNFINCRKINQKAVSNLFRDSLLKMQLMGTEKIISLFEQDEEEAKAGICLPGSEIPEWFCYKNIGSSINVPVLRNDCGRSSYIMGFAVCVVFHKYYSNLFQGSFDVRDDFLIETSDGKQGSFDVRDDILIETGDGKQGSFDVCDDFLIETGDGKQGSFDVCFDFLIETSDGHKEGFFENSIPVFENIESIGSDHILLGYNLSRKCYELFQKLDTLLENRSMSDYVGTSFAFKCNGDWCYKVKYCGIQPIYVQSQVMNFVAINQDTGESNDTEETCEPHPKRICTEANQCS